MDRIALLKKIALFSNLSEEHLSSIAEFCVEKCFRKGDVIIKQGDFGIGLYFICCGKVNIVKKTAGGENLYMAELGPGDFFGEMTVLDNAPRSADVIAFEECKCLVLTAWDFKSRMKVDPEIALKILPVVVKRFRETNERLLALSPPLKYERARLDHDPVRRDRIFEKEEVLIVTAKKAPIKPEKTAAKIQTKAKTPLKTTVKTAAKSAKAKAKVVVKKLPKRRNDSNA